MWSQHQQDYDSRYIHVRTQGRVHKNTIANCVGLRKYSSTPMCSGQIDTRKYFLITPYNPWSRSLPTD